MDDTHIKLTIWKYLSLFLDCLAAAGKAELPTNNILYLCHTVYSPLPLISQNYYQLNTVLKYWEQFYFSYTEFNQKVVNMGDNTLNYEIILYISFKTFIADNTRYLL